MVYAYTHAVGGGGEMLSGDTYTYTERKGGNTRGGDPSRLFITEVTER